MRYFLGFVFVALCIICLANGQEEDYFKKYEKFSLLNIMPTTNHHLSLLRELKEKYSLDLWSEIRGVNRRVDLMASPQIKQFLLETLEAAGMNVQIAMHDISHTMRQQRKSTSFKVNDSFDYGNYHTLDEIHAWIDSIVQMYPKLVTSLNITQSYEGRNVKAFKISVPSADNKAKPAMWFDGGIHAREWISPATVIYIAYSLLSKYGTDADVTEIMNTFDFYILPVFNVDGYVYTFEKDRLWRKTRSKTSIPGCLGADPNRNWDDHFCEGGASRDPCSDEYCGAKPFSEPETKGVSQFLAQNNDTILCYINFHSYSQLWMSPWGWTDKKPANYTLQDDGSAAAVTALAKLYGTQYDHGNIAQTIYIASGSSVDWTFDVANIFFSYAVELRDQGQYGFVLPPDQIIPSGLETFEGIKALAFFIKSKI